MTDPGEYAALLDGLPQDVPTLVRTLQGLLVHIFWTKSYGLEPSPERLEEVTLRSLRSRLGRLLELDPAPLGQARSLEHRLVSNCRDFSLMMVGMLIHLGVPARARCGFATYFMPDHYEDHWVVEYWHAAEGRWVMFDSQLDKLMLDALQPGFDPLDMPSGQFVSGGEAWLLCRREGRDPERFGIFDMQGWDFIRGNLYRDLLALNKVEILPWDFLPGMGPDCATFTPADWEMHDQLAELTTRPEACFADLRARYESDPGLHVPADWR
jgi:hypothetical protein